MLPLFMLSGCPFTSTYQKGVATTYSETNLPIKDVGFDIDSWLIRPIIVFEKQLGIHIFIHSSKLIVPEFEFCPKEQSIFTFRFWANNNIEVDLNDTFFSNQNNEQIKIKEVKKWNGIDMVTIDTKSLPIKHTSLRLVNIPSLWNENDVDQLNMDENEYEFTASSFVGCSGDSFKLTLYFNNLDTGKTYNKELYFYPVTYETMVY